MIKWELAQMMGLRIEKSEDEIRSYYSYAKTSSYDEKFVSWIVADDLQSAKEEAAEEYFQKLNKGLP